MVYAALVVPLLVTLPLADEPEWKRVRLANTGLFVDLPEAPQERQLADGIEFKFTHKSLDVTITARKAPADRQAMSRAYSTKFGELREKFGNKIKSIFNEAPVPEAYIFGAEGSMGFVLEIDDSGGLAYAWQQIHIDGYQYTLNLECSRKDQPLMEKLLSSAVYVDPTTGDFRTGPIGGLGLSSYLGGAFLPTQDMPREDSRSLVLDGEAFPVRALGTVWSREEVIFEDADLFKEALTKWLSGFVQGARVEIELKQSPADHGLRYDISGSLIVQGALVQINGVALTDQNEARAVIAVVDPKTEGSAEFARRLISSVKWLELENNSVATATFAHGFAHP